MYYWGDLLGCDHWLGWRFHCPNFVVRCFERRSWKVGFNIAIPRWSKVTDGYSGFGSALLADMCVLRINVKDSYFIDQWILFGVTYMATE